MLSNLFEVDASFLITGDSVLIYKKTLIFKLDNKLTVNLIGNPIIMGLVSSHPEEI